MSKQYNYGDARDDGFIFYGMKSDGTKQQWYSPSAWRVRCISGAHQNAKTRAKKSGVPFEITKQYLRDIYPKDSVCPALGIEMAFGGSQGGQWNSPSLDRIVPEIGYVEGNVIWVSGIANMIKTTATPEQILKVGHFYSNLQTTRH